MIKRWKLYRKLDIRDDIEKRKKHVKNEIEKEKQNSNSFDSLVELVNKWEKTNNNSLKEMMMEKQNKKEEASSIQTQIIRKKMDEKENKKLVLKDLKGNFYGKERKYKDNC